MRELFFPTTSDRRFRLLARLTLGAMLAATSPSWAQARPQGSGEAGASASDLGTAKIDFANAQKLFKAGKFADALPLFRAVADSTRSPNARLYVGHCLEQLGKHADAYKVFSLIVKELTEHPEDKYEPTREAAVTELAVLNVKVAKLVISLTDLPPELGVTLDGVRVDEKDLGSSIVLLPGAHRVEALANGFAPVRRDVSIEGGEVKTVTLAFRKVDDAQPAAPPVAEQPAVKTGEPSSGAGGTMRTIGYVAGGVGIAGLAVFAITGLMAKSTFDKLESECAKACSDPDHLGDIDSGKSLQTTANVGLVVGLLGLGGGTTLVLLGSGKGNDGASVSVSRGGGTLSYTGHF
jgi:hypothetical protein